MGIQVRFRGPMVFLSKDRGAHVDAIVIPNASSDGCHPDDTIAKRHYRKMLIIEGGQSRYVDLSRVAKLAFAAQGETGNPPTDADYSERVSLNQMANPGAEKSLWIRRPAPPADATIIKLVGGSMTASSKTGIDLELPKHKEAGPHPKRRIPVLAKWVSQQESGTYKIDDEDEVPLTASMRVYVYNWDEPEPNSEELELPIDNTTVKAPFEDLDMKWIYTLFEPPAGMTWKSWLGGDHFPVPRTPGYKAPKCGRGRPAEPHMKHFVNPSTSTCDGVSYCDGDPC